MEAEEITKLVDGVYKNILDKFNPGARQLIAAGKNYLKALHGAAAASRLFNETLAKMAMNAQQSGTGDIGSALMSVVNVNKEIQEQQMNILKAFYVDLLVPLETNLEKDTKVVQHEQKKFLQQHKVRMESYQKAVATMKKQRKKKTSPENTEKELRSLQVLEDQKKKLDVFCDQSYKNAMTQERRRYGFVLERQCSIAKHWMAYHTTGKQVIDNNFENWQEIAASREIIPATAYENSFNNNNNNNNNSHSSSNAISIGTGRRLERIKDVEDDNGEVGAISATGAHLKKSHSVDTPYGDMRTLHQDRDSNNGGRNSRYLQNSLPRAKSDFNLATVRGNGATEIVDEQTEYPHMSDSSGVQWDQRPIVKALYAYMPSGENQLSFDEGDRIALVGSKAKGWQFGENLSTQNFGWFPIAYTNAQEIGANVKAQSAANERGRYENMRYERNGTGGVPSYQEHYMSETHLENDTNSYRRRNHSAEESSPTRMFGDTINFKNQRKYRGIVLSGTNPRPGPPPTLPAPVAPPTGASAGGQRMLNSSQSFCAPNGVPAAVERRKQKLLNGIQSSIGHLSMVNNQSVNTKPAAAAKTSLHSSNDSGFANEPPPQPEVDYSDEEATARVPIRRRADTNTHSATREVTSWTLNRNFRNSVDSQIDGKSMNRLSRQAKMRYDLIASDDEILQASSSGLKRTKSFWKFGGGRSDDILAGMSLWQHRDLVAAPNLEELRDDEYRRTINQAAQESAEVEQDKIDILTKAHNMNSSHEKQRKDSLTSTEMYGDEDENIYGISPAKEQHHQLPQNQPKQQQKMPVSHVDYTPKSRMKIMKTIEIDIENHAENERISTIKRGQHHNQHNQQEYNDIPRITNGREPDVHNRNSMTLTQQRKIKETHATPQQSINHNKSQTLTRVKAHDFSQSTDEGESDEQGTLKMSDVNNFFDDLGNDSHDDHAMVMKTVKRKDILKQYYTSEDDSDAEIKSTSSDPYDCIVINDHLVRKDEKLRRQMQQVYQQGHQQMEFQTFRASTNTLQTNGHNTNTNKKSNDKRNSSGGNKPAPKSQDQQDIHSSATLTRNGTSANTNLNTPTATILPRTRLLKSSTTTNSMTLERSRHTSVEKDQQHQQTLQQQHYGKTYGPWYDFWDQQEHHGITSQKSSSAKLK